jgi:DNA-binding transcriptional LysR family regulator
MDRLEAMALLIETVECGSMSAAGRKLNMPVPTLSRKLSDLENHLGTRLLTRSTRRLELTDAGAGYLAASRRILEQVSEAERDASGEYVAPRGELVITAPLAFGRKHVLPVVNAFLAQHPDITVRLGLADQRLDLVGEHVDLAVRIGTLQDSSLMATRVGDIRWIVVASPAFLAAHGTPRVPEDLDRWPCVGVDFINLDTSWCFRAPGASADYRIGIRSRLAVTTGEGAVDAAVAGVGITQVLRYQTAPHLENGALQEILQEHERAPMPLSIVYTGGGRMPLKTRSFLDFAAPCLKARLSDC